MSNTYNGWANYETWNFMLWEREGLNSMIEDLMEVKTPSYGDIHTAVNGYLDNMLEYMDMPPGFAGDVIGKSFSQVDLHEITQELMDVFEIVDED